MKVALVIAAFCIVACLGENATETREKRQTKGRFLSLPVPQKCSTSKCCIHYFAIWSKINIQLKSKNINRMKLLVLILSPCICGFITDCHYCCCCLFFMFYYALIGCGFHLSNWSIKRMCKVAFNEFNFEWFWLNQLQFDFTHHPKTVVN